MYCLLVFCLFYLFLKFIVVCDYGYRFVCGHFEHLLISSALLAVFCVGLGIIAHNPTCISFVGMCVFCTT